MSVHNSVLGEKLWWTDPIAVIAGKDSGYTDTVHGSIPTEMNRIFSDIGQPAFAIDKAINPARRIGIVDDISTWTENKPADTAGLFFGAAYGAPALGQSLGMGGGTGFTDGGMGSNAFSGLDLGSASSSTPATQGMDWGKIGGNVMTNVGSSLLTGLMSPKPNQTISGGNSGSGGFSSLNYLVDMATNVRPAGQRGGFQ